MARTDAQRRAQARYNQQKVKRITVAFYPKDDELYNYVTAKENMAGYLKDLIRKEYESHSDATSE